VDYYKKPAPGFSGNTLTPEAFRLLRDRASRLLGDHPSAARAPETAAPETAPQEPTQRRVSTRRRTLLTGKLVFNDMASVLDCVVRDLSENGARIKLAALVQLPPAFDLRLHDGRYYRCKVRRRTGLELGVEFLG
jgi:PilZ domain